MAKNTFERNEVIGGGKSNILRGSSVGDVKSVEDVKMISFYENGINWIFL